jgi:2-phospho-L-lactate/phosphoenolpyruvate guanylyltransferase
VFVACDDDVVAGWAEESGASVLWGPGLGLNGAIDHGVNTIAGKGFDHVVIAHGDLPLPAALASVVRKDTIVLVPDRRSDGTNVLARPCRVDLPADYGGGSYRRHLEAAIGTGIAVSVRRDPHLSIDVDTIADCRHPDVAAAFARAGLSIGTHT